MWWSAKMSCSHADGIFEQNATTYGVSTLFQTTLIMSFVMLAIEFSQNLPRSTLGKWLTATFILFIYLFIDGWI
jgi:hypothetical protein